MTITIQTAHIPPSVNECYANVAGKGRVRTKRYKLWSQASGWDFNGKGAIKGPFSCVITIDRSARHRASDIDNRIKPTMDMLQAHGIIENDNLCEVVTAAWGEAKGGMRVVVSPYADEALP